MSAAPDKTPSRIAGMFDAIAPRYDLLNHVLSAGLDRALARPRGRRAGSAATGRVCSISAPGRRIWRSRPCGSVPGASVVGVDFAGEMLALGLARSSSLGLDRSIRLVRGDATRIPLAGRDLRRRHHRLRHPQRRRAGARARRDRPRPSPGGRLAILEFGQPRDSGHPDALFAGTSATCCRPSAGWSRSTAAPIRTCRRRSAPFRRRLSLPRIIARHGFSQSRAVPLTFGIVYLFIAEKS